MAQRPDGKGAGTERVVFTRPAADRIAKVVRKVESGNRDGAPLVFDRVLTSVSTPLRLATVTGQWATGTTTTVTFYGATSAANTAVAQNFHLPIEVLSGSTAECVIGKAGGTWTLLAVNFAKLSGFMSSEVQMFGHNADGYAQWYSITTCSTATAS